MIIKHNDYVRLVTLYCIIKCPLKYEFSYTPHTHIDTMPEMKLLQIKKGHIHGFFFHKVNCTVRNVYVIMTLFKHM